MLGVVAVAAAERPNILFIMTDDHAAHAISAYGSRVNQTPNLDRLAREGMLLRTSFVDQLDLHAEPRGDPHRQVLAPQRRAGVQPLRRLAADGREAAAGGRAIYTGMIGKWHLGSDPTGFDHWEILPGQGAYVDPVLYTATGEKTYTGATSPTSSPTSASSSSKSGRGTSRSS